MWLELTKLTDTQLFEKQNDLAGKMTHMSRNGRYGSQAYEQCMRWQAEIQLEMMERMEPEQETGVIATIGEDVDSE